MADPEIINKLIGLVVMNCRIEGFEGEGREHVVFSGTYLEDGRKIVLKFYQFNPMFLLNEVDFWILPPSGQKDRDQERYFTIIEKLLAACKRKSPSLFFSDMRYIYKRVLVGLYYDFEKYKKPVLDTTILTIQNEEFIDLAKQILARKQNDPFGLEGLDYLVNKMDILQKVIAFITADNMRLLSFNLPTSLLLLIFSQGFFGEIPIEEKQSSDTSNMLEAILSDNPYHLVAEDCLREFLDTVEFKDVVTSMPRDLTVLQQFLMELRTLLLADMLDDADLLRKFDQESLMKYKKGRNNLLRALPRFLRVLNAHLHEAKSSLVQLSMTSLRVGIYVRTSIATTKFDKYESELIKYCGDNGWDNIKFYRDRIGGTIDQKQLDALERSLKQGKLDADLIGDLIRQQMDDENHQREGINRLLRDTENGELDVVIVHDFGQLGRSRIEMFEVISKLLDSKTELIIPSIGRVDQNTTIPKSSELDFG